VALARKGQALAARVRQAFPAAPVLEQVQVLPQPLRQRVAPVRASLWPCLAPTHA
jgi:hypothetical protein